MEFDDSWDVFYEYRTGVAVALINRLTLPVLHPKEEEYIKYAIARMTVGGAKPLTLGVLIGGQFYRFSGDLAPAAGELIGGILELTLTGGMQFVAQFEAMAGAEVMDLFVHGFRKKRHR